MLNIFNQFFEVDKSSTNRPKHVEITTQVPVKLGKLAMRARHVSNIHCLSHRLPWTEGDLTCSAMALAAVGMDGRRLANKGRDRIESEMGN